jgi:uncharacterized protein with ATP-grasp and redox domains
MTQAVMRPAPWTCERPAAAPSDADGGGDGFGTFAHRTCTTRWPATVRHTAVRLPEELAFARPALAALADEIAAGALRFDATTLSAGDLSRFAALAPFAGRPWTALPWYAGEALLYARIRAAVEHEVRSIDPFLPQKRAEEAALQHLPPAQGRPTRDALGAAVGRALWGNRADLSLPDANRHDETSAELLLVDHQDLLVDALLQAGGGGALVQILLDNAGVELAADLALAAALRQLGCGVRLWAKDAPFFVSDAMPDDVQRTAALLGLDLRVLGIQVVTAPWTTGPGFLDGTLPADAQAALTEGALVIAKGDCNYRRLVGDVPFSATTPCAFADATAPFPHPVLYCLRTLKAEVQCGPLTRPLPDDVPLLAVLTSGRFGVVQGRVHGRVAGSVQGR